VSISSRAKVLRKSFPQMPVDEIKRTLKILSKVGVLREHAVEKQKWATATLGIKNEAS
jgi:Fe2+ or Zn2+ uptake regulation protein